MTIEGILENLVSDLLFILIAIVVGWLFYVFSHRSKMLKFFGIEKSRRIVIYLSNLRVKSFGSVGIDGRERSYQGSTAAFGEMIVANRFRDLFNYFLPSLSDNPGLLSKFLISDVQVQLLHSPLERVQAERSTSFITLGSPAYNIASELAETELRSKATFGFVEFNLPKPSQTSSRTFQDLDNLYPGATGTFAVDPLSSPSSGSVVFSASQSPEIPVGGTIQPPHNLGTSNVSAPEQASQGNPVPAILVDGVPP